MRINRTWVSAASLGLLWAGVAYAQNSGWEGETGVFITPMAYTAASTAHGFGLPIVGYHYLDGGNVLGDFHEISITDGAFERLEFGYTRALHTDGSVAGLSPLWHDGFNIFHGKVNLWRRTPARKRGCRRYRLGSLCAAKCTTWVRRF